MLSMLQTQTIFPTHAVANPGPLPRGAKLLELEAADGSRLHGVHIPPLSPSADRLLILGFGGNAWNAQDAAIYFHQLYPAADVVTFHYRGYRPSTGTPSAKALLADAPIVYDFAVKQVDPKHIVAVGMSIGSGIAANLAAHRTLDGLILVTPFDSLEAVATGQFPWLPIGMVFEHEIEAAEPLRESKVPVAIVAGERDTLIPPERTEGLRRQVGNLAFDRTIASAGHNDIYHRSEFHAAMRAALDAVLR
ncbi:alpha/beta hydrolase [Sphingomonas sp.]|uniref:alpha/beta hydrolase n=1 Tax=Sphingomonas sp. TaxID=28214 RepID=UPI00286E7330|nr:alpha/beta hydrolase [Sphingomonas sp.]